MDEQQRKTASHQIGKSIRDDYLSYIDGILRDMETAERTGNTREITRLRKILSGKSNSSRIMPSKDLNGSPISSQQQLLESWNEFLTIKFETPETDIGRAREHTVSPNDHLSNDELEECLKSLKNDKAPGHDGIPIEGYQHSPTARVELFRIVHIMWDTEDIPPELIKGLFIMLFKKGERNDFGNYRAICLLCHAYKLLSAILARRLHKQLEHILPDSQAGFRQARGTRDNVCILKWAIQMVLKESKDAVITFIDYKAAFDTESQTFLDEALGHAGVSTKIRRIIQSIFNAATGCVQFRNPNGSSNTSEAFNISRGVLQGDIFSPVAFIVGLWRIFTLHDQPNAGITLGDAPYEVTISKLEYADDAGLLDVNTDQASVRLTAISTGSKEDAAMIISIPKTKAMHIHHAIKVSETTEEEVKALQFKHKCPDCPKDFPTSKGMKIHHSLWCDGGKTVRSRKGSLADKAVQHEKRKAAENERDHVMIGADTIDNVYAFTYLGSHLQCDGEDTADIKHRMAIAQSAFSSLNPLWKDHRLPLTMKLKLYKSAVCSTLTHACEAWNLTDAVSRKINGFNSRCLHVITRKPYRETATKTEFNLLQTVRLRRLRFLGHILHMNDSRIVKRTLLAFTNGGTANRRD